MPTDYERLKVKDLKDLCKKRGCTNSGEKGILIWRLKLSDRVISSSLEVNGATPFALSNGELKKVCAQHGVSPMLTPDEMMEALVKILETKKAKSSPSSSAAQDSGGGGSSGGPDPVALAQRVMELAEIDDDEAILNLGSKQGEGRITKQSPVAVMRKAYLKLSLVLHPDKLSRLFDKATSVFQAVVRAFERLSTPDIVDVEGGRSGARGAAEAKTIARSNEGCHRTRVCCPRCKVPWSENTLDGNPDYFYNFLMMGLKRFTCSTCLCEFGCMTALHKCPHCKSLYEYSPADYHRKVACGSAKCGKPFGFYMFHTSERVMRDLKTELKEEQDRAMRAREGKQRRAARAGGRGGSVDEERAFLLGLSDSCPRCGQPLEEYGEEQQRRHLMECTDEGAHKQHAQAKAAKAAKEEARQKGSLLQEAAERQAAFQFLGAKNDHLYLLDESQLQQHATLLGVKGAEGKSKDELIYSIAAPSSAQEGALRLSAGPSSSSSALVAVEGSSKRRRIDPSSLPRNLQGMSESQLRSVCASHGIFMPADALKIDMVEALEGACYDAHTAGAEQAASKQLVVIDE